MKHIFMFILLLTLVYSVHTYAARDNSPPPSEGQTDFRMLKGHSEEVLAIALSPDGKVLASGGEDEIVILWDVATGEKLSTLKAHGDHVRALSFSPDGRTLASGSTDRTIVLWNVETGEKIRVIRDRHMEGILSLAVSPDGKTLVAGTDDEKIILWNSETGDEIRTLKGHSDEVNSVLFSPDGRTLASGGEDMTIILWDAGSGEKRNTLKGHSDVILSLAFSPDGQVLASGSSDRTIALWNTVSAEKINVLTDNKDSVHTVAFSPDGGALFSASEDRNIIIWNTGEAMVADGTGAVPGTIQAVPEISVPDGAEPSFAVKAPVIEPPDLDYSVHVGDENGNGVFEGGETITVFVKLENRGKGDAQGVEILMSGNNTLISCLGNSMVVGDVEPDGKKEVLLKCVLPTRLKAETAHLSVELAEQRGYSPAEIKSFTAAMKPAEIRKTERVLSRHIDVDTVPAKIGNFKRNNSFALVIGISRYRDKDILPVKYAKSDAEIFAKYLENVGGVPAKNIKLVTDDRVTKGDLEAYIEDWLPMRTKKDSEVFIYYAGHGTPDPESGEAYIVPYDGHPDYKSKLYPLKRMYASLNKLPSEQVVVMLDSCFSGAGERGVVSQGARPLNIAVENPILAGGNVFVLASASGSQISSDFEKVRHGLFTYYLLKGMKGDADEDGNESIELKELYRYVKTNVSETASAELNREQMPVLLPDMEQQRSAGIEITRVK